MSEESNAASDFRKSQVVTPQKKQPQDKRKMHPGMFIPHKGFWEARIEKEHPVKEIYTPSIND
ncbi:MAG: hypothetical protein IKP28_02495 [Clostridia bacterium]|nr:hypothetical protein [Clostridia bacterium]